MKHWYLSRSITLRLAGFSAFYMAQGVPIGLFSIALPAWLVQQGADAADIATLAAITGLPWGFKLIAGPFMDRFTFLPMGRRRPWVLGAQVGLTLSLLSLALVDDPLGQFWTVVAIGFVINTFAALQDVAVDGMAIDVLPENERGRANAFMAFGQVIGFSGFGALDGALIVRYGLPVTVLVSTLAVGLILLFATLVREREGEKLLPWTEGEPFHRQAQSEPSVGAMFRDLLRVLLLPMSLLLVGVEFLFRASAGVTLSILPIFAVQELGYSAEQYAYWVGALGAIGAFIGIFVGPAIDRFGVRPLAAAGLLGGGLLVIVFALSRPLWGDTLVVIGTLGLLQVLNQAVFIAMIASFMGICWARVAATQFAIYMSLANLSRSVGAGLFALIATQISTVHAMYLIAGLLLAGGLGIRFFNPAAHRARLADLDAVADAVADVAADADAADVRGA